MSEYLYIIRCHEFTKIGVASNVKNRLKTLQTGNPYPLELVKSFEFDDVLWVEGILHRRYDYAWVRGEWFDLSDQELADLIDICENKRFEEIRVRPNDQEMVAILLQSALSYCTEAGIEFEIYNDPDGLIVEVKRVNYIDGRLVVVKEPSKA